MAKTPTFDIEDGFAGLVAGVDEAGRGPLAGPVVAAAVILDRQCVPAGIRDSKTLSESRRGEIAGALWKTALIGVGSASVDEIDSLNIARATMLAMARAAAGLAVKPSVVIVDGAASPRLSCPCYTVIGGDALSMSIAAASIVAKDWRDRLMRELARVHPDYGWDRNKGYAVEAHLAALARHGATAHHRRSFAPVHNRLYADSSDEGLLAVNEI